MTHCRPCGTFKAALLFLPVIALFAQTEPQSSSVPANSDGLNLRFANGIAAIVEDKPITVDDIRREISPLVAQLQREARNEQEFNQKLEALQDEIIQNLIDRELMVKEFYKKKDGEDEVRKIPPSFIDNRLAEVQIEQFDGDRSKFLAYLRSRGITLRDYRKEVEQDIVVQYMHSQQRKSQSILSPVKIEQYYNENQDRFFQEDSVHLRMVQFTRGEGETDEQLRERAAEVVNKYKSGDKFEDLAKHYSQDSRRSRGGDWGWQKRTDLKKEFSDPLFTLKKGEITDPIMMSEGCFILFAEDRKYSGLQPIDEVRDQIERILLQQMSRSSQERWLERLRRNGYVKHY
ncbi:MAG: peptidylprolyl isomerase [Opitutaceae bacterium]|jgi:peptidyl-prolyl cis-trans isomerase SurA